MRLILITFTLVSISLAQLSGIINGIVIDAATRSPVQNANVFIPEYDIGTSTDINGYFLLDEIPIGTSRLVITMIGYEKRVLYNLPITTVRPLQVEIPLNVSPLSYQNINVVRDRRYNQSTDTKSTVNIDQAELRNDPIGIWDAQRSIQSLPSVDQIADQINGIIVRGGSPGENLFIMDNIEIQNPNHFGVDEIGGGGMSLINPAFINSISFTPGAFSARYGDKASSVMDISLREGSKLKFEMNFDISIGGLGLMTEGPIAGGKGSYLFASAWSYLDIIVTNNVEYTSIPHYNHHQAKIVYNLNSKKKLILNLLLALDDVEVEAVEEVQSFYGVENILHNNSLFISGLTYQRLLGNFGYANFTLSLSSHNTKQKAYEINYVDYPWFSRDNNIFDMSLNNNWYIQTSIGQINAGFSFKSIEYDHNEWARSEFTFIYDTKYWKDDHWEFPKNIDEPNETGILYYRPTYLSDEKKYFNKFALFIQDNIQLSNYLNLTAGLRFDYFSATDDFVFSPRISIQFSLNPASSIYFAFGRHFQFPDYQMLLRSEFNTTLKTKYADHLVFGAKHYFTDDFLGSIELYYKKYHDIYTFYYWSHDPEIYPGTLDHIFQWLNEGEGESYGLEFFLQKKLTQNWHGILSYSWSNAHAKDVRSFQQKPEPISYMNDGKWYEWDFNIEHKLTVIGGWKKKLHNHQWYNELRKKIYFKIFSPIIPLADEIELSLRFVYSSGRPFTLMEYSPKYYDWDIAENASWNDERYPAYRRMDILFLRRYNLSNFNLVFYIDFLNILNHDNVFDWLYNKDGSKITVWHLKTLPLFGITLEL